LEAFAKNGVAGFAEATHRGRSGARGKSITIGRSKSGKAPPALPPPVGPEFTLETTYKAHKITIRQFGGAILYVDIRPIEKGGDDKTR
ncbi:MAG: hypothetical protein ACYTFG_20685, partial [Planctomycetota bacterium]